jgi:hypothetical protein
LTIVDHKSALRPSARRFFVVRTRGRAKARTPLGQIEGAKETGQYREKICTAAAARPVSPSTGMGFRNMTRTRYSLSGKVAELLHPPTLKSK